MAKLLTAFVSLLFTHCGAEMPSAERQDLWQSMLPVRNDRAMESSLSSSIMNDFDPLRLCENVAVNQRRSLLQDLKSFPFANRQLSVTDLSRDQESCVLGLIPAALYTNLRTGVPASVLIAQAIQETGWCRSKLARDGANFHGQKAKFSQSHFRFWDGDYIWLESSEDPSGGGGNKVRSQFMAFGHADQSFYSVAERFRVPGLPYGKCLPLRGHSERFARCIGQYWAVHQGYTEAILAHRSNFRSVKRPSLRLASCDLSESEWFLEDRF